MKAMEHTWKAYPQKEGHRWHAPLIQYLRWGLAGGLVGTLAMDLLLMIGLSLERLSPFTCFSMVGETVARLFQNQALLTAGGIPAGVVVHYLIGPIVGGIFGAAVNQLHALRVAPPRKIVLTAVVYVQILSQPLLASSAILLKMNPPQTLQWFGISFFMHLIFGILLGTVTSYSARK